MNVEEKLKPYWGFENPRMEEYQGLKLDKTHLWSRYSDGFAGNCNEEHVKRVLERTLKDAVVFDIGCGRNHSLLRISDLPRQTKACIGVDLVARDSYTRIEPVDFIMYQSDMLQFLAQIYSGTGDFIFNGIDFLYGSYLDAVADEVERATKEGGVVFGRGSQPIENKLAESGSFVDFNISGLETELWEKWEREGKKGDPFVFYGDFFLLIKDTQGRIGEYVPEVTQ